MEVERTRWSRIEDLYEQALALATVDRPSFLKAACGDDAELFAEVRDMLAADEGARGLSIERLVNDEGLVEAADPLLGVLLGPWRVIDLVGRGGSGTVFLAERADGQYEQRVALKLVGPGPRTPQAMERFRAERRILARFAHPNIARLIDGGLTPEGTPYLVMDYVDGTPITTYCDERRLSLEQRLQLFCVVCDAVQHAHRALIVHRDLKPSNIYVSTTGEVKLLDFGIAKLLGPDALGVEMPPTRTEARALTPAYAAPEQLRGDPVTTATDVYALGVLLYELLTGRRPFVLDGLSAREIEETITHDEPPPPSDAARASSAPGRLVRRIRGDLDRICLMALRKEPERRYASAEHFADELQRFLQGRPVQAQTATLGYRARRFVTRNRLAMSASVAFAGLVIAFGVVAVVQARLVAAERDRVRVERDKAQEVVQVLVDLFQATNPEVVPGGDRLTTGEFLTRVEPRVLAALGARPEIQATMKHVLGKVHAARSDYAPARTLLEEALAASRRLHGPDDAGTIGMQVDLAELLLQLGDDTAAGTLLDDALARSLRTNGERHALTARSLVVLAGVRSREPERAKALLDRALSIRRAVLQPGDLDLAATLDAMAVVEMNLEHHAESRALFEEARRIAAANNGGRNAVALKVTNDFAALLGRIGDHAGAEPLNRDVLALATEIVGPESFQVANAVNNLGTTLAYLGRLQEANDLFRQAFDRHVALFGEAHFRTANAARNIGLLMLHMDRTEEARAWMDRAVHIISAAEGPDSRTTVYMRATLARVLTDLGRRAEAIAILESAVARLTALGPPEGHYTLADTELYLGHALLADGKAGIAEPYTRRSLEFRQRVLPAGHDSIAVAECELARTVAALDRGGEARGLLESCVPAIESMRLFPPSVRSAYIELRERLRASSENSSQGDREIREELSLDQQGDQGDQRGFS